MSVGPFSGPVQRPSLERDVDELLGRVEALERVKPGSDQRRVSGTIGDDGSIVNAGSGDWSVIKAGSPAGVYLITFDTAFAAVPAVTATVTNDDVLGDGPFIATLDPTRDESSVTVRTWAVESSLHPFDGQFDFDAVGS